MNRLDKISAKKYVFVFGIIVVFSFFHNSANTALASELIDQQFTGTGNFMGTQRWVMSPFVPSSSNIIAFEFDSQNNMNLASTQVYICRGTISSTSYGGAGCGSSLLIASSSKTFSGAGTHKIYFSTTSPALLYSGLPYFWVIHIADSYTHAGNTSSTSPQTFYSVSNTVTVLTNQFSTTPRFKTYYDSTVTGINNLQIILLKPINYVNVGLSSPAFEGLFRDDNNYADGLTVYITNLTTGSSTFTNINLLDYPSTSTIKSFGGGYQLGLNDVPFYANYSQLGTSSWTAYLTKNGDIVSDLASTGTFIVGTNPLTQIGDITIEQACTNDDLATVSGQFSCAMKRAFYWTIYPSANSVEGLKSAGEGIKNSFPFTVYFQLTDTINNTISSTTLSLDGSIGIPMINKQKQIYIAPFLSSSTLSNAVGQTNATLIRNTMSWLIWLILAIGLYFTIKKL